MEINKNILRIYQNTSGKEPFIIWLESIKDTIIAARIKYRLRRIEIGNLGDHKSVGGGVFELRLFFGSGYRIYFGKAGKTVILLLCGGDKNSQNKDIAKAISYWHDFKDQ